MSWSGLLRSLNTSLSYGKWGPWTSETKLDEGYLFWDLCLLRSQGNQGFKSGMHTRWVLAKLGLQKQDVRSSCIEGYYLSGEYQKFESIIYFFSKYCAY